MSRPETCLCPCGCRQHIPRYLLACKTGWFELPQHLRDAVTAAYADRAAHPMAHLRVVGQARRWYRDRQREREQS